MKIFLICSVRGAPPALLEEQGRYVDLLRQSGHSVHYPPLDTNQSASGLDICRQNLIAMLEADEVHIFYRPESQGTHFDMGMAFALGKNVRIASNVSIDRKKSFSAMAEDWMASQKPTQ